LPVLSSKNKNVVTYIFAKLASGEEADASQVHSPPPASTTPNNKEKDSLAF